MIKTISEAQGSYTFADIIILGAGDSTDYNIELTLDAPETTAKIVNKAIVASRGNLKLSGLIKMTKKAELARADLTQKVLLLGEDAHATAVPELEIENNEVKATHAASVGQLDKRQVEFLRRRGFSKQQATKMLVQAFVEDVLDDLEPKRRIVVEKQLEKLLATL